MRLLASAALAVGLALAASCGGDGGSGRAAGGSTATGAGGPGGSGAGAQGTGAAGAAGVGGAGSVVCTLGTVYPNRDTIDPDAPDYEEPGWTKPEVAQAFADAKAADDKAYRAYRAAHQYAQFLECPFCACGCAIMDVAHQSAVDCFKDMHGFT